MIEDVRTYSEVRRIEFTEDRPVVFERREGVNYLTTETLRKGDRGTALGVVTRWDLVLVRMDTNPAKDLITAPYCVRELSALEVLGEIHGKPT